MAKRVKNPVKLHDMGLFVKIAVVVAFVGVAGIVTATAFQANKELEATVIADGTGAPKAWDMGKVTPIAANSAVSAEVLGQKYIQFTAKVANANSGEGIYVTHMAAYLSSDGATADGFIPLSKDSLEYSYTPEDSESWQAINLAQPSKDRNAFKLASDIRLGAAGTKTAAVYFRYYVTPEDAETQTVNSKASFALKDDGGEVGYTASAATVAYAEALRPKEVVAVNTAGGSGGGATASGNAGDVASNGADLADAGNAYAAPLGQSSFVPELESEAKTIASVGMDSDAFLTIGVIMMVAGVLVFAVCLAVYLPLKKY